MKKRSARGLGTKDSDESGGGAPLQSSFRRMLLDLMEQHPNELEGFVGEMTSSKYRSFSDVIAEASIGGDPLQSPSVTMAFKKIDEAIAKGEGSTDDDDFDSDLGSDLSTDGDLEAEDEVVPLNTEFSTMDTTEGTLETRSCFAMGDAALRGSGGSGTKPARSHRQLLMQSSAGSTRRQESFRVRTSIRENCNFQRSVLRESVSLPSKKSEDILAIEISYREFLEGEIDQLEKLLDDQGDEIDNLDRAFTKSKKQQKELASELKTTKRSVLILEEKYALFKTDFLNANKRADKLQIKLLESEMEKDLFSLTLESDQEHMEVKLTELRELKEAGNDSIAEIREILVQKDLNIMNIMSEMQALHSELKTAKEQRDSFEKKLTNAAAKKKEKKEKKKKKNNEAT